MKIKLFILSLLTVMIIPNLLFAQYVQQGAKLFGTGGDASSFQGSSFAVSLDDNTAIVGGYDDNSFGGAVWVFTRTGNGWIQQGQKLVGSGAVGSNVYQGFSTAISSDGNTFIEGGWRDDSGAGAAWVFTRSNGVWTQQGQKLVGSGAVGNANQGRSVAISADGNTAFVGGEGDSNFVGAVWVFTRSGGVWTQQGQKLVGTGAVGIADQGISVAISSDGNIAFVGSEGDSNFVGAVWVFTRTGGVWTQQGQKLVGIGASGHSSQGASVASSLDGNTFIVGGPGDSSGVGAVWVFARNGGVWVQQGQKLVGTGAVGNAFEGNSVAISSEGNTVAVGGEGDSNFVGAVWIFTRSGAIWTQQGQKLVGSDAVGAAHQGWEVAISSEGAVLDGGPYDNNSAGAFWIFFNPTTGVSQISSNTPAKFKLEQNYPNPFNPSTSISFSLGIYGFTSLRVYDVLGREVAILVNEQKPAGTYTQQWNATALSSGVYFYRLQAGSLSETKKLLLLK
jgi:hypothetical protein